MPVDCSLGESCFIQNYVDGDPSPGVADFSCGPLSYDTHKGTDFALPRRIDALAGVDVLAAADGVVRATRDGLPDDFAEATPEFPRGQDCGNGLVIDHGDGWETQYCHLKSGTVTVRRGQQVQAGTPLGQIGMSGNTQFAHLHMSVRQDGQVVDPFNATGTPCGSGEQLWADPIAYVPGGLLQAGFSPALPDFNQVKLGRAHAEKLDADQGALVLWAHVYGSKAGDQLRLVIEGPNGVWSDQTVAFDKTQAQVMRASGRRLHAENTVPGGYRGTVIMLRDGQELGRMTTSTELRD